MGLDERELPAYAAHVAARQGKDPASVLEKLREDIATGELRPADVFAARAPGTDAIVGSIRLVEVGTGTAIVTEWRGQAPAGEAIFSLLTEATGRAAELGLDLLITRIDDTAMTPAYRSALTQAGFQSAGRRVEYKTPLAELPPETEGRLTWRTMAEAGSACVLELLEAASADTPDMAEIGSLEELEDHLSGAYGELDPRVVQVGFLDERSVAVLVARVEADGWSTLPFMGLVPDSRGRGLGREVHLHGLGTVRALGGTLYHDGTSEANTAMMRVFARHGCAEHSRMEEWRWSPPEKGTVPFSGAGW